MSPNAPSEQKEAGLTFSELRESAGLTPKEFAIESGYHVRTVYRWERGEIVPKQPVMEQLRRIAESRHTFTAGPEDNFTFIDLFAGIGGMRKGFEAAGGRCVFTSEWDKYARTTYAENFPDEHPIAGDITKIPLSAIPEHDVLVAGFPCQPFSIAGVSKKNALGRPHGFLDNTQGTLFFDVARILKFRRPKAFLLENVKNLERHDKGKTFRVIRDTLDGLGYHYDWRIIDAKGWVPQHRERIFIAGFRDDLGFSFDGLPVRHATEGPTIRSILHTEDGSETEELPFTVGPQARVNEKYILTPHMWDYLQRYAAKHKARGNGFGFGLVGPDDTARTLSARYYKDGSEILVKTAGRPRRLTPRECARLMGFDDAGQSGFSIPVSDAQAYRQFGNAVVVPVVENIAHYMLPFILGEHQEAVGQLRLSFDQPVSRLAGRNV
ncbi:MAG: DNA (cytosine-5-)-methyltransferase [Bacteroidetes bacterium]|nr:DNA (cytosine-5-)-methyltransferase [Bacteroidota bacterium]